MLKYKIALVGKANSGKNTVANILGSNLSQYDRRNLSIAFADPIKDIILMMFPEAEKEYLFGPSHLRSNIIPNAYKNNKPLTYRQCLIDIGELARSYNPNIWINKLGEKISKFENFIECEGPETVIVSDVRRINEAAFLKEKEFFFIKIKRELSLKLNHSTETDQDEIKENYFDYIIDNNGSIENLKENIINIIPLVYKKFA
jgi:hypothetical protein